MAVSLGGRPVWLLTRFAMQRLERQKAKFATLHNQVSAVSQLPKLRTGQAFSLEEHARISAWDSSPTARWPRIELALNYPDTPEMLGIVEHGQVGPTFFMWRSDIGVVVEPFSGGTLLYPTIEDALAALTHWAMQALQGRREPLRPHQRCGRTPTDIRK